MAGELEVGAEVEVEPIEGAVDETIETTETPAEGAAEGAETGNEAETDDAPVSKVWGELKEKLKDTPHLHRQVKNALHSYESLKKNFPDGVEKAVERLEAVNQLDDDPEDPDYMPGSRTFEEVISNTIAERTFWRDFDTAFQAGDGRVVKQMIEANPMSFQKLIPEAMDHYQQINPDGYSAYICKSVSSYLDQNEIPLQMALLARVLPEKSDDPGLQTVIDAFQKIGKVVDGIRNAARNPIEPKKVNGQAEPARSESGGVDEQAKLRHDAWLPEIAQRSNNFAVNEALKLAGKTRFTPSEIAKIQNFVRTEVNVRTKANDAYQRRVMGLLKANNKVAYSMTVESEHKKIISEAVKRIVPQVISERTKPGPKPGQKPAANGGAAVAKPGDEQFELIAGPPRTLGMKVDFTRTPHSMMAQDRAYIVGRAKPVRWRRK